MQVQNSNLRPLAHEANELANCSNLRYGSLFSRTSRKENNSIKSFISNK